MIFSSMTCHQEVLMMFSCLDIGILKLETWLSFLILHEYLLHEYSAKKASENMSNASGKNSFLKTTDAWCFLLTLHVMLPSLKMNHSGDNHICGLQKQRLKGSNEHPRWLES